MSYDIEKYRREQKEKEARERAEFAALTAELERVLADPHPNIDTLDRQADLLDCMLYAVMRHNLARDKRNGCFSHGGIELALRIQKQGMDTAKAAGTLSYMNAIASLHSGTWPALPVQEAPATIPPPLQK